MSAEARAWIPGEPYANLPPHTVSVLREQFIATLRYSNGAPLVENHERPRDTYEEALADAERKLRGAADEGVEGVHASIEKRLYLV